MKNDTLVNQYRTFGNIDPRHESWTNLIANAPWVELARQELHAGICEEKTPERIASYFPPEYPNASPKTPWCGAFNEWLMRDSGMAHLGILGLRAANWRDYGIELDRPRPGAIVTLDLDQDPQIDHVGVCVNIDGDEIRIISGNYSNKVAFSTHKISQVKSSRWPVLPVESGSRGAVLQALSIGSRGTDVVALQRALNKFGYGLTEDGNFGLATDAALRDWQQDQGITVDGQAGRETFQRLATMRIEKDIKLGASHTKAVARMAAGAGAITTIGTALTTVTDIGDKTNQVIETTTKVAVNVGPNWQLYLLLVIGIALTGLSYWVLRKIAIERDFEEGLK